MINAKEAPLYKGFLKIFFVFLLAMVGGFLGGELRALKADALTSSVPPPRSATQGPWMLLWGFPESSPPQKLAITPAPPLLPPESAVVPPSRHSHLPHSHTPLQWWRKSHSLLITHTPAHLLFDFIALLVGRASG